MNTQGDSVYSWFQKNMASLSIAEMMVGRNSDV